MTHRVAQNSFQKGMNKDLGVSVLKNTQYIDAHNFRLHSYDNSGAGELNNIKGNSYSTSISQISDCWTITLSDNSYGNLYIYINGFQTLVPAANKSNSSEYILYIKNYIDANSDLDVNTKIINDVLYIYSDTYTSFVVSISPSLNITHEKKYSTRSGLRIIGSATMRDDFILFTTDSKEASPTDSYGQIWKLEYDDTDIDEPIPTITLLYNGILNFSLQHPIEAQTYYENNTTKKVYWTDNYNYLRYVNIEDPTLFSYDADDFDIISNTTLSKPTINRIKTGGELKAGVIQYAYQLYNTSGSSTIYSPVSNFIHITDKDEGDTTTADYYGALEGDECGKTLDINIKNIDTDYDNIRVVSLFFDDLINVPEITIIREDTVPGAGSMIVTDSGRENLGTLTLDEFRIAGGLLFTCKTLASKDNHLFPANITYNSFDIDFDARAYRFKKDSNETYVDVDLSDTDTWGVSEDADCINPYNKTKFYQDDDGNNLSPSEIEDKLYMYQRNSDILGGSGVNVSFRFGVANYAADDDGGVDGARYLKAPNNGYQPWTTWQGFDNDNYSYTNTASPYLSGMFKGYQRDEVYAFGVVFYSNKGQKSFVKWIADIRMPSMSDMDGKVTYKVGGVDKYRYDIAYQNSGSNDWNYCNSIYVDFDIDIPSDIVDQISGAEIVRMERGSDNRTVLAQGMFGTMLRDGPDPVESIKYSGNPYTTVLNYKERDSGFDVFYLVSPEISFNKNLEFQSNDFIRISGFYDNPSVYSAGDFLDRYKFKKTSTLNNPKNQIIGRDVSIVNGSIIEPGIYSKIDGYSVSHAEGYNPSLLGGLSFYSKQGTTFDFILDDELFSESSTYDDNIFLINYMRPLSNQYGGNTYNSRFNREYISTGSFKRISNSGSYRLHTFGGDTFVDYFESLKQAWPVDDIGDTEVTTRQTYNTRGQHLLFFPVESSINLSLRNNKYSLYSGNDKFWLQERAFSVSGVFTQEKDFYVYNSAYSRERDIEKYYPRQFNAVENDEYDCRILASNEKIAGEERDNWTIFQAADFIDINSSYGQINKVINYRDRLLALQDNAFGVASVNDRSLIQDGNTAELVLGTGGVLPRFDYISVDTGTKHQWSVLGTKNGLYWFDVNKKNMMKFSSRLFKMSDIWGMNRYFDNNVYGDLLVNDNPHYNGGINCYYDDIYNEVVYTFSNHKIKRIFNVSSSTIVISNDGLNLNTGDNINILYGGVIYTENVESVGSSTMIVSNNNGISYVVNERIYVLDNAFTVSYSEDFGAYNGFYDFYSPIYLQGKNKLLSLSRNSSDDLYLHNIGDYANFYGVTQKSSLKLLINDRYPSEKIYNSQEVFFNSENTDGVNIYSDFWDRCRWYDAKQNTDWKNVLYKDSMSTLPDNTQVLAVKRERGFNMNLPKNAVASAGDVNIFDESNLDYSREWKDRMRDTHLYAEFEYNNTNNNRINITGLYTYYSDSIR